MPTIRKNTAQEQALKEISDALNEVKSINQVLQEDFQGTISIVLANKKGKGGNVKITNFGEKERAKILSMVVAYRSRTIKELRNKASKFNIKLEEEDEQILHEQILQSAKSEPDSDEQWSEDAPAESETNTEYTDDSPSDFFGGNPEENN
jgi:hypothetical protein